jgi:hypothetical protein
MRPTLRTLSDGSVNRPGAIEVVRQRLFDHLLYVAAGQTTLNFFQQPIGQGVTTALGAAVGAAKTRADTNLELAGQLPAFKNFVIESIELTIIPGTSAAANTFIPANPFTTIADPTVAAGLLNQGPANDITTFYRSGWLVLFIGSKEFLVEAPFGAFPPKTRTNTEGATAYGGTITAAQQVSFRNASRNGRPYFVQPEITLPSGQNFVVQLNWPGVVALPSGFNARIGVVMDGFTFRNSQ